MSFFANSIPATGTAHTNTNVLVTATATASAHSDISYEDAEHKAFHLAKHEATTIAKNTANIIDQTLSIVQQESGTISTKFDTLFFTFISPSEAMASGNPVLFLL